MDTIATQLRALQFLSHRAHNMVKGPTFFEDHEFLGEIYPAYEAAFDSVIERIIGTGSATLSIVKINKAAAEMARRVEELCEEHGLNAKGIVVIQ